MSNNITFLIAGLSSGAGTERACLSLANKLAEIGYNVNIVALKSGQPFFDINPKIGIFYLCDVYKGKQSFITAWFKLHSLLNKLSTDILINVGTELSLLANLNVPRRIKIIACEHFTYARNLSCTKLKNYIIANKIFCLKDCSSNVRGCKGMAYQEGCGNTKFNTFCYGKSF